MSFYFKRSDIITVLWIRTYFDGEVATNGFEKGMTKIDDENNVNWSR